MIGTFAFEVANASPDIRTRLMLVATNASKASAIRDLASTLLNEYTGSQDIPIGKWDELVDAALRMAGSISDSIPIEDLVDTIKEAFLNTNKAKISEQDIHR